MLLSGCALKAPDAVFIGSSAGGVYARLPQEWVTMSMQEWIEKRTPPQQDPNQQQSANAQAAPTNPPYLVFFGRPVIDPDHILDNATPSGVLFALDRPRDSAGGDVASDDEAHKRSVFNTLPELISSGMAVMVEQRAVSYDGRLGQRYEFIVGDRTTGTHVVQESVLSADGSRVLGIALGCSHACFTTTKAEFDRILTNWRATS